MINIKFFSLSIRAIIFSLLISLVLNGCFIQRIPTVNSYKEMPYRKIEKGQQSSNIEKSLADLSHIQVHRKKKLIPFTEFVPDSETNAFLILKEGKLIFEWYAENFNKNEAHASFSMAKSITSALVGIAIEEGKINSVQDKVVDYLPNLDSIKFKDLKILHLLQMTSGIRYSELDVFHSLNALNIPNGMRLKYIPGEKHEYWSAITQLLGLVLKKAIEPLTISEYLSDKIWKPMGAEFDASWSVDNENGVEKTFCCIQGTARDFLRFGLVYLNYGFYNEQQIVPQSWIEESVKLNEEEGSIKKYNYGWWLPKENTNEFMARGFKGQYIFINQSKKTVVVRLGKKRDGLHGFKWSQLLSEINEQL